MKKNKAIYYFLIFCVLLLVGGLFEGAILTSETLASTGEKLFWSAMNAMVFIGIPVAVISVINLSD